MEEDPFAVIESMTIAGYAVGSEQGFLYVRGEYPLSTARLEHAIRECRSEGLLGPDVMGGGFRLDIDLRRGAGAYICGEETALFNSIEGFRGEPRNKPPCPVDVGLFGKPTVVNNVETPPRVRHSRKLVLELLASSVDLSLVSGDVKRWMDGYEVDAERFGPSSTPAGDRDGRGPWHYHVPDGTVAETVAQPVKIHDEMYIRDYAKCILCYKRVEACGEDAQNTFAIVVAGRGFDARISTEFDRRLDESACVYCGNCIGVCQTGALMFKSEHDLRQAADWDESAQQVTRTICPYCGVGCNLELHVQGNDIVKVTSPQDHSVTNGHLCIKGRFGWQFVQNREKPER